MSTEWQERVQEELDELTEKLVVLRVFIASQDFRDLSTEQRNLLTDQSCAMAHYADILSARLIEERSHTALD